MAGKTVISPFEVGIDAEQLLKGGLKSAILKTHAAIKNEKGIHALFIEYEETKLVLIARVIGGAHVVDIVGMVSTASYNDTVN